MSTLPHCAERTHGCMARDGGGCLCGCGLCCDVTELPPADPRYARIAELTEDLRTARAENAELRRGQDVWESQDAASNRRVADLLALLRECVDAIVRAYLGQAFVPRATVVLLRRVQEATK